MPDGASEQTGTAFRAAARGGLDRPSAFFLDCEAALVARAALGPILDLACGRGRHALAAADLGLSVLAVDHDAESLEALARVDANRPAGARGRIETRQADLEASTPPPLVPASFAGVMVFRYLHRPLFPWIESLVAPGGCLIYETFTLEQRTLGWGPRRDAFLLRPGELRERIRELEVQVYEEGLSKDEPAAQTARLLATRPG